MGQVPGEVVAEAFGCFNPKAVVGGVTAGWQITTRAEILDARERGATSMLQRILGDEIEGLDRVTELLGRAADAAPWVGRAVYSGLRWLGVPDDPMGAMWRAADLVRAAHWPTAHQAESPRNSTPLTPVRLLGDFAPVTPVEQTRYELSLELLDDVKRLDLRLKESHKRIKTAVRASGTSLTELYGVGPHPGL